jgi:histone H3/H4
MILDRLVLLLHKLQHHQLIMLQNLHLSSLPERKILQHLMQQQRLLVLAQALRQVQEHLEQALSQVLDQALSQVQEHLEQDHVEQGRGLEDMQLHCLAMHISTAVVTSR